MKEKATLRKYKWLWPWQDDVEEAWLREMSQQGWRDRREVRVLGKKENLRLDRLDDHVRRIDREEGLRPGIAGSAVVGRRVTFAGQSGASGHISIGDGCVVAAKSAVVSTAATWTFLRMPWE